MITLLILIGSFAVLFLLKRAGYTQRSNRELANYSMAFFLVFFGLSHFYKKSELMMILPSWVPFPEFVVYVTGVIEIVFAIGLLFERTRRVTGVLVALFFVAILPANVHKAINDLEISGAMSSTFLSWVRLFFQPIFIVWVLYSSKKQN
ncbi:hypothetical protein [Bacillus horti]|uniref:Membrane protein n=1 Tax=Caldalkalibacillus horti TaxID=77523 RepID=A0ABT9W0I6_9BACI|nr:hypothetical protein [Bacillus horti]MDQ0166743.1 putative membrane protein [Bacillus horti]